jgi:hypothetical protein
MAKKKVTRKKNKKRPAPKKARSKKTARKKKPTNRQNRVAEGARLSRELESGGTALTPESEQELTFTAGQSGDTEGLSAVEDVDSESVEELAEEGQDYEAEIVDGVERAGDQEEREVRTDVREEERPRQKRVTL